MLNCIIIDDEPLAIKLIENFIERTPFLSVAGKYLNPLEALSALPENIHLIFLDIQMPGLTGLELSRLIPSHIRIIFTTAYRQYAYESYEVQALDYLLKPINYTSFLKAATRAKEYFDQQELLINTQVEKNKELKQSSSPNSIFVKNEFKLVKINLDEILFISALKDYVKIHLLNSPRPIIALITMKAVIEKLPADRFIRVHRSYIVALDKIENIERSRIRINGESIPVSETNYAALMEVVER